MNLKCHCTHRNIKLRLGCKIWKFLRELRDFLLYMKWDVCMCSVSVRRWQIYTFGIAVVDTQAIFILIAWTPVTWWWGFYAVCCSFWFHAECWLKAVCWSFWWDVSDAGTSTGKHYVTGDGDGDKQSKFQCNHHRADNRATRLIFYFCIGS